MTAPGTTLLVLMLGALSGCSATWPVLPWFDGPIADASTPHVIYFERDAYKVENGYREMLEAHARRMKNAPRLRLLIQAYTDRVGATEYNRALSRKRAETVMKQLVELGVPSDRMEIAWHGELRPGAKKTEPGAGASDRRVELVYR